jgi:16S rRNA C967 or C1407 C5-methylase (RsmB/RsmF family)
MAQPMQAAATSAAKAATTASDAHASSNAPKEKPTAGEQRFEAYYAQQHLVDDFPQLLAALRKPLPITFRIFDATRDGTGARLEAEAVKLGATRLQAKGAWTFAGEARRELRAQGDKTRDGALRDFLVRGDRFRCLRRQEEVSMASVEALDPRPNDVVLDCCAAPGSKTTQLVERCEGGCVVAVEYDAKRARALVARSLHVCGGDRAARLVVCKGDATKLPSSQRFDRVLCDVPCSGDGALRKTGMRAYRRWRCADALALHDLQLRIALRGADLLKVDGRLVYSTCSLNPIENEAVVSRLLAARPDLELVDHGLGKAWRARPGLTTWRVLVDDHRGDGVAAASDAYAHLRPPSTNVGLRRCARLYPHDGDRGGFFLAVFSRKCLLARGGVALPTEPQPRLAATDAHPLRRIDEDAWARLSEELDVRGDLAVYTRSGGGARGAGAWLLDRTAAEILERLLAEGAGVKIEGAGIKIVEKRGGGEAARQLTDLFDGRLTFDGADALLRRGALGPRRVVDVDAKAWRALLKGGRIPLSDLPAALAATSPGTAVARHGGSSITLWRGAADAVTVMVRGDDLERLRRGVPVDRPFLPYAVVAVAGVVAIAVMRRR